MPKGTSLALYNEERESRIAVYVSGYYSTGYLRNVYNSQSKGGKIPIRFLVVVYPLRAWGKYKDMLEATSDPAERRQILEEMADEAEKPPHSTLWRHIGEVRMYARN